MSIKNFLFIKKTIQKQKKKIPLMYLVMKMKQHTVFILQNKLLKSMLIYYYYRYLKIIIMFWLKILIALLLKKQSITIKIHFSWYCLQCFSSSTVSEYYTKNCLVINQTNSALLLKEGQYVNFRNFKSLIKAPFIHDFECV